jgi:hypothetical protein
MRKSQHIPNEYMFRLDEFLHRDTSPQGRERFTRVTVKVTLTMDQTKPYIEVNVRSITDYQRRHGKGGRYIGWAGIMATDDSGIEYNDETLETMLRSRITDEPSKVLVRQVVTRAKRLTRAFIQGRV